MRILINITHRLSKKEHKYFNRLKKGINNIDDETLKPLVEFMKKVGGDGDFSDKRKKLAKMHKELFNSSNLIKSFYGVINKLVQETTTISNAFLNSLGRILDTRIIAMLPVIYW